MGIFGNDFEDFVDPKPRMPDGFQICVCEECDSVTLKLEGCKKCGASLYGSQVVEVLPAIRGRIMAEGFVPIEEAGQIFVKEDDDDGDEYDSSRY